MEKSNDGYYTKMIEHAHRFSKQGMRAIAFYKNLIGTTFDVYRLKDESKARVAYGVSHLHSSIFSQDSEGTPEYDRSEYDYVGKVVLVFPLAEMRSFFEYQSVGSVEVIDNDSSLKGGDELVTTFAGKVMMFKVESKESYGDIRDTITRYMIAFRRIINQ